LNHRSQVCEVLAGTGISRRKKTGARTAESASSKQVNDNSLVKISAGSTVRAPAKMDGHVGSAPTIPVWKTGVYLSTLMPGEKLIVESGMWRAQRISSYQLSTNNNQLILESRAGIAPAFAVLQTAA
jgi:hypothetical protein